MSYKFVGRTVVKIDREKCLWLWIVFYFSNIESYESLATAARCGSVQKRFDGFDEHQQGRISAQAPWSSISVVLYGTYEHKSPPIEQE